jgi:hypothetical protein
VSCQTAEEQAASSALLASLPAGFDLTCKAWEQEMPGFESACRLALEHLSCGNDRPEGRLLATEAHVMSEGPEKRKRPQATPLRAKQKTQPKPFSKLRGETCDEVRSGHGKPIDPTTVFEKYQSLKGARTKKTPECVARILQCLELGLSLKKAAVLAGITFETLNEWRKADPVFSDQCKRARIFLEERMLRKLNMHAEENLRAVTFALERICSPKKYGKKFKPIELEIEKSKIGSPGKVYRIAFDSPLMEKSDADSE